MYLRVWWLSPGVQQRGSVSRQSIVAPPWRARVTPLRHRAPAMSAPWRGAATMPDAAGTGGHVPVLPEAVVEYLAPRPGAVIVDATVGLGGHSAQLLPLVGGTGRVIGLDQDPEALRAAAARLGSHPALTLHQANFRALPSVLQALGLEAIDGLLVDLGVSSLQLETPARGFSFQVDGPLDMRMDPRHATTAAHLVRDLSERELADCFFELGEERHARRIARAIVGARRVAPITTTTRLADIIERAVPRRGARLHPATRVFQALRLAVNRELDALEQLLQAAPACVRPGGRIVVIAFHSLEDRPVKRAFRAWAVAGAWRLLTKKPVRPSAEEIGANPRARSARLRAVMRVA